MKKIALLVCMSIMLYISSFAQTPTTMVEQKEAFIHWVKTTDAIITEAKSMAYDIKSIKAGVIIPQSLSIKMDYNIKAFEALKATFPDGKIDAKIIEALWPSCMGACISLKLACEAGCSGDQQCLRDCMVAWANCSLVCNPQYGKQLNIKIHKHTK